MKAEERMQQNTDELLKAAAWEIQALHVFNLGALAEVSAREALLKS
jgi:hypothetical protein